MPEKQSVDRRDFLKSAAVTGAAAFDFAPARALVPGPTPAPPAQVTAPASAQAANVEMT